MQFKDNLTILPKTPPRATKALTGNIFNGREHLIIKTWRNNLQGKDIP